MRHYVLYKFKYKPLLTFTKFENILKNDKPLRV